MEEQLKTRSEEIHEKGFDMNRLEFNKIKVNNKNIEDVILEINTLNRNLHEYYNKGIILKALVDRDVKTLRAISNHFYVNSGIYQKACNNFAYLYRYDWYVVPEIYDDSEKTSTKIVEEFTKVLNFLDNAHIKKTCGDIALKVIRDGAYYGYKIETKDGFQLQELPINYCRSRYSINGSPVVEFDMRFFDEAFSDVAYRLKVLKLFPPEFSKGYLLYKQGKLQPDFLGDLRGWYLLDPEATIKFSVTDNDIPIFVNAIPAILDLDAAQALDRKKQMQKLLKILVQKLPLDKNGDLIFDIDEAKDIHANAVTMLSNAIGVDVLTTFTDVESIDLSDKNTATTADDLKKIERTVFNALGMSQNLFNTDGNLSLEKSILNDESSIRSLLLQFAMFYDNITQKRTKTKKKYNFRLYMLETTQYNYKELSKMYKEQVQIGYSKMLPQIAMGHSQSAIINTAYFENEVLKLSEIMIPPLMSSTMSSEDVLRKGGDQKTDNKNAQSSGSQQQQTEPGQSGRPEKPDDQKSEKTIKNKESMS